MTYGLQCWNENGDLTLDVSGRYTRLVYSTVISSSGSVDLPAIDGHETVQWGEPLTDEIYENINFVTRDGTTIDWPDPSGTALILVFLYT